MDSRLSVSLLEDRRRRAERRLSKLRQQLKTSEAAVAGKACVYATGSFGRLEASDHSDLDLFIVGLMEDAGVVGGRRRLFAPLDETLLKADLIRGARDLGFPEFDRDGEFLVHHSLDDLTSTLGRPEDDAVNTFTARLLLLLEGRPILGKDVYARVLDEVIRAYWVDFEDHEDEYLPGFLVNDILRLWRTFCVNYEVFTKTEPPQEKAKRRLKNYKLRHSRILTCFSAIAYLLELYRARRTVRPDDVREMALMTLLARLRWLGAQHPDPGPNERVRRCLERYEAFLRETDAPKAELVARFSDPEQARQRMGSAREFGDEVFHLLVSIEPGSELYRLLVI